MRDYTPHVLSSSSINGDEVYNAQGEHLGEIKELMIDLNSGQIAYAVLSFGGFLGIGDKLFALPWEAFTLNSEEKYFVLNVDKERFDNAPGFDKDNWPSSPDRSFIDSVYSHYGYEPYYRNRISSDM
jgi:sporulation protein YlmC with PRC-barrel domain